MDETAFRAKLAATVKRPSCGKPGMAVARLCGYCWTKLTPAE